MGTTRDPQRIAAEAANHVAVGFLQGAGFALATVVVGIVLAVVATVFRHPEVGILAALAAGFIIYKKFNKKQSRDEADHELALIEAQELEFKATMAASKNGPAEKQR